jgi:hypothetical protein
MNPLFTAHLMRAAGNECPNGHRANSEGNCFTEGCPYHVSKRHDGIGRAH